MVLCPRSSLAGNAATPMAITTSTPSRRWSPQLQRYSIGTASLAPASLTTRCSLPLWYPCHSISSGRICLWCVLQSSEQSTDASTAEGASRWFGVPFYTLVCSEAAKVLPFFIRSPVIPSLFRSLFLSQARPVYAEAGITAAALFTGLSLMGRGMSEERLSNLIRSNFRSFDAPLSGSSHSGVALGLGFSMCLAHKAEYFTPLGCGSQCLSCYISPGVSMLQPILITFGEGKESFDKKNKEEIE
jgi:hypothetical protein